MSKALPPRDELASLDRKLAELTTAKETIEAQIDELCEKKRALRRNGLWDILQEEMGQSEAELVPLQQSFMDAVDLFVRSLSAPPNYEEESTKENGFAIPFNDTDDYADFTALDAIIDEEMSNLQESLTANAAHVHGGARTSSEGGSRSSSFAGGRSPQRETSPLPDDERARQRRRLLLRLLFITLHVGRLEALCHIDEIKEDAEQVIATAEELKEEVAEMWHWVTVDHRPYILTEEEREEWSFVLKTYIGAPFCAPVG